MALTKVRTAGIDSVDRSKLSQVLVYANSSSANGGFASGAWEGIPYETEVIDTNSAFVGSASTDTNNAGIFTCPVAGKYFISVGQVFENTTSDYNLGAGYIRLTKHASDATQGGTAIVGTKQGFLFPSASNDVASASTSCILDLSVGNVIWAEAYANWHAGVWRADEGYYLVMQIG